MRPKNIIFLAIILMIIFLSTSLLAQPGRSGDGAPKVGEVAPLFKLKLLNSDKEININEYVGKKPIILIFGSYT